MSEKYEDEELKARALELRKKGMSYKEIAKELGCSPFKLFRLLSECKNFILEDQLIEVLDKIEELRNKVLTLENSVLNIKPEAINEELPKIRGELESLKNWLGGALEMLETVVRDIDLLRLSAGSKLEGRHRCKWLDSDGYCTYWYWDCQVEEWDMRSDNREGKIIYRLNVKKHPLMCASCPTYRSLEETYASHSEKNK